MTTKTNKGDRRNQSALVSQDKRGKGGAARKGRKPIAPVKVSKERNWGPIAMFAVVGLLAAGIIGYAFWAQWDSRALPWQEQAAEIEGLIDYRAEDDSVMGEAQRAHQSGPVQYDTSPPAYGPHNEIWQNCQGDVYPAPIANEHAVHSLEHGAIWITYNPDLLDESGVDRLASLVEGNEKMMMSPYPSLDAPISLQAWGYQLKLDDPGDGRINEFIRALRVNSSLEGPNARCDGGVSTTGTTPIA
ncbi:DUF3105 domain-containing protein [Natronosporangium hydrolyticum]|uniref:DUF3105 domain-containing protein n=1 Tax=Natronosporangium hydrolyticum TaxID=2811111 RepID=A0A895YIK3_9ACTN|nr:DUF3105 domain-containing protein [Natronosporangium hydrolyticum]QSB15835.1 DUF3105 domain-containing protein [Natronosporangium hydrolyticum]